MARYFPTEEEVKQLIAKGWQVDSEGWWWPVGEVGYGRNYKNAIKEQKKREIRQKKTAVKGGE